MKKDTIIGIFLAAIMLLVFVSSFIRIVEMNYRYNELNYQLQKEINSNVDWLFKCDYVHAFYNCPKELQFINMTGKYCNNTLTCKNEYIIKG